MHAVLVATFASLVRTRAATACISRGGEIILLFPLNAISFVFARQCLTSHFQFIYSFYRQILEKKIILMYSFFIFYIDSAASFSDRIVTQPTQLLSEDGCGYELARQLEACGTWREWLGDDSTHTHTPRSHNTSHPSMWDTFLYPTSPPSLPLRSLILL